MCFSSHFSTCAPLLSLSLSHSHTQICNIVPMSRLMSQLNHIEVDLPTIFTHMHNDDLPSLYTFIQTFNIPSLNSNTLAFIIIPLSFLLFFAHPSYFFTIGLPKSTFQLRLEIYFSAAAFSLQKSSKRAASLLLSWENLREKQRVRWKKRENEESGAYCCDFPALLLDKRPAVSPLDSSK